MGVLLFAFVLLGGVFELYTFGNERQASTVSAVPGRQEKLASPPVIGIVIQALEKDRAVNSRLGHYLQAALEETGHSRVQLLQAGHTREHVDILLVVYLDLHLPRTPFFKKGDYTFEVRTVSLFTYPSIHYEYRSQGRFQLAGIFSRRQAEDRILQEEVKAFVEGLNKSLNASELSFLSYRENVGAMNLVRRVPTLKNTVSTEFAGAYAEFIPQGAQNLFVYRDERQGERGVIIYTTGLELDALLSFFEPLIETGEFVDFAGGRISYQYEDGECALDIMVKYLDQDGYWGGKELKERVVTIYFWHKPQII